MKPVERDYLIKYVEYTKLSNQRRGQYLNTASFLERSVEDYISNFFCISKKRDVFISYIMKRDRASLSFKFDLAIEIIVNHDRKIIRNNKTIVKDLERIRKFRNDMAHYTLQECTPAQRLKNKQTVYVGRKQDIVITEISFEEEMDILNSCLASFTFHGRYSNRIKFL